jgi:hypothetical protein
MYKVRDSSPSIATAGLSYLDGGQLDLQLRKFILKALDERVNLISR